MDNNNTITECPLCGIKAIDGVFYWTNSNKPASADTLYSRVCGLAQKAGKNTDECINKQGKFDKNLSWMNLE